MRCDGLVAEVQDWAAGLEEVHARIAGAFARAEPRARVLAYLRGLLGQLERVREAPPEPDELAEVRDFLVGVFPLRFETTGGIAGHEIR